MALCGGNGARGRRAAVRPEGGAGAGAAGPRRGRPAFLSARDSEKRPCLYQPAAGLRPQSVYGAGLYRAAQSGADGIAPRRRKKGQPFVGAGQDPHRHGGPHAASMAGKAAAFGAPHPAAAAGGSRAFGGHHDPGGAGKAAFGHQRYRAHLGPHRLRHRQRAGSAGAVAGVRPSARRAGKAGELPDAAAAADPGGYGPSFRRGGADPPGHLGGAALLPAGGRDHPRRL